jgi:hypothetical protein
LIAGLRRDSRIQIHHFPQGNENRLDTKDKRVDAWTT